MLDLGLSSLHEVLGFESHAIVRAPPCEVWAACADLERWPERGEFVVLDVPPAPFALGASFRIAPRLGSANLRLVARPVEVVSVVPGLEIVWQGEYFRVAIRHGLRVEPYWHEGDDENRPATSTRFTHSLAAWGIGARLLSRTPLMARLENAFHRFNAALADELEP